MHVNTSSRDEMEIKTKLVFHLGLKL